MKRSTDTAHADTSPTRRALLVHRNNPDLLASGDVVAFLDNEPLENIDYRKVEHKLVRADERALLVELIKASGRDSVTLCETDNFSGGVPGLEPGMLEHIVQHLPQLPSVSSLEVAGSVITAVDCALLQAHLNNPHCPLRVLSILNCHFADAQVAFPAHAPTVHTLVWKVDIDDDANVVVPDSTPQLLPALKGWTALETLKLLGSGAGFSYPALAQLLLANPNINRLRVYTDVVNDPVALFDALASNRTQVRELTFEASVANDPPHNELCLRRMVACMATNETLEVLKAPGFLVCSVQAQQRFARSLDNNRSLTSLAPLNPFDHQTPLNLAANKKRQLWFSRDFMLGAAEAFMQQAGAPRELGARVAATLSTTPTSRTYCGPVMALLSKTTHAHALKLRSAGLREVIRQHMLHQRKDTCLAFFSAMATSHIELMPEDKQAVVALARRHAQLAFLPAGYAG